VNVLQLNVVCGYTSTGRIATDLHAMVVGRGGRSAVAYGRGRAINCDKTIRINIVGYFINIDVLFKYLREKGTPVIWTLHDCSPFTGHCGYFDLVACERWRTGCFKCPQKTKYPESYFLDRSHQNYAKKRDLFTKTPNLTFVTPSVWLSKLLKDSFLGNHNRQVINNGIDIDKFSPKPSSIRLKLKIENHFVILGVASVWEDRKGFGCFLSVAKQLTKDEVIVLVGLSDSQMKRLPERVIGIKNTKSVIELAQIYSLADVFVNPTLEDNFPTTNLESLACGTPVITFDSGGSAECMGEGCGLVVKKGDMVGLRDAIAKVKTARKESYSKNCRRRAEDYYNKNDRFRDYIELYQKLMNGQ
jgi:putative colanic acid biosynthesis glycosyltransferase